MKRLSVMAAVAVLALAGCGGDDEETAQSTSTPTATAESGSSSGGGGESSSGGGETLKISADPSGALKFDKAELTAKAGEVQIEMANPSDVPHAVAIEGGEDDKPGATVGKDGTSTASAKLEAGEYTYYCPVGGHRAGGMEGTLTVQ